MNRNKGSQKLKDILGSDANAIIKSFEDVSPDFARHIVDYAYGEIYSRTTLNDKIKELATVACLIGSNNSGMALKVHLKGMLHVGWTADEIKELILFLTVYAGFPPCVDAINILSEIEKENMQNE
jgi:4-carboxymuconolactone decarboxylase